MKSASKVISALPVFFRRVDAQAVNEGHRFGRSYRCLPTNPSRHGITHLTNLTLGVVQQRGREAPQSGAHPTSSGGLV